MGAGKLQDPACEREAGGEHNGTSTDHARQPLTVPEIVSELVFAGKSLQEIARYTDYQLRWIVFRKRDKYGALVRRAYDEDGEELPEWVETDEDGMRVVNDPRPFGEMFRQVKKHQGLDAAEAEWQWHEYQRHNPKLAMMGLD